MPQPAENTNTVLQSCPQTRCGARHSAVTCAHTSAFKSNKQHLESTVSPALGGGTYNQWDNVSLTDNIIPAENFRACTETQKCRKCQSCTWGQVSISKPDLWASGVALLLCSSRWLHAWIKYVSQVAKDLKYYNRYLIWIIDHHHHLNRHKQNKIVFPVENVLLRQHPCSVYRIFFSFSDFLLPQKHY